MVAETATQDIQGLFDGLLPRRSSMPMTGSWPRTAARKTKPTPWSVLGWQRSLPYWGMAHVQPHTPADPAWLRPASPTWPCRACSRATSTDSPVTQELLLHGQRRLADAQPGSASA